MYGNDIDKKVILAAEKNFQSLLQDRPPVSYTLNHGDFGEYKSSIMDSIHGKMIVVTNVRCECSVMT